MDLVGQWVAFLAEEDTLSDVIAEQREHQLRAATLNALATDPAQREALLRAFRESDDADPDLRMALGAVLLPPHGEAVTHPEHYRSHPEVAFDAEQMPVRIALGLPVAVDMADDPDYQPAEDFRSWFGGSPATPASSASSWRQPVRGDGEHLTLVVQVDLATETTNQGADRFRRTALPEGGLLQVFHDLETFGWNASDDTTAWQVSWHPLPDAEEDLVLHGEPTAPYYPINAELLATVPSPLDLQGASDVEWERYERARCWLEQAAYARNPMDRARQDLPTPWDEDSEPVPPVSRLGGYGHAEASKELADLLADRLPVDSGDEHVLLADINPGAITTDDALINWFHGERHLEVWMRRSDLDACRFSEVWAVIRTDN